MELNRASDVPAADCQNQTHKKNDPNFFTCAKMVVLSGGNLYKHSSLFNELEVTSVV